MNILVTLNSNYIIHLIVMLTSLIESNPGEQFTVYVAHSGMSKEDFTRINHAIDTSRCKIEDIKISDKGLSDAPITSRYPKEMYYRIFAVKYLPDHLERILYLDPDLVVINPLKEFYTIDFQGNFFAAASHVKEILKRINHVRLNMAEDSTYVNSGVMMMNLSLLRQEQDIHEVYEYIEGYKHRLFLPDQDVLNGVYSDRTLTVDAKIYNLSERYYVLYNLNPKYWDAKIDLDWVRNNTVIIHYCGRNKPWKENYMGELDVFYKDYAQKVHDKMKDFETTR
ncbi:LPS:glycosyltransferase [Desulfitobacterium dehalogenans ATCC 51507]|uniref:LPS:glycosyltransferase n=1 Tax=Desulfitobacterium dehalogenans (strain ATCC 51507 / DSM 9161 / JW/IU-DC1) TaxID=756499 RepID=I4A6S1_DESDJ|nr:glycosyltransferase family 8 protein [Desulfitobacterium dehalogenans]AFL99655.1 LPS:glycosyltransferase [Desulfitobacterium dehalogenans ATCC 51507]